MAHAKGEFEPEQADGLTFAQTVFASLVSIVPAALTIIPAAILSMPFGGLALRMGLVTDEGAAWFGITIGIPFGILCAGVVFVLCFTRVKRYLQS